MWAYQVQDLEKDFKVLAPTFSSAPRSFRLYCDIIDFLMQKEMIESAAICGLSYGGFLCQYFAKYYPGRVSKLILSHTLKPNDKYARHLKLKSSIIRIIPNFIYIKKFQKRIQELDNTDWMAYRKYYFANIFRSYSKKEFANGYTALAKSIIEDPLEKDLWKGSTVILTSKDDTDVLKYQKDLSNTYPQAELYEFEKGGHHTALTYPVKYTEVLREYIQR
jgi:pimeloyl-ACP methyl ester carboxylesterase